MQPLAPLRMAVVARSDVVRAGLSELLRASDFVAEFLTFRPDEFDSASVQDTFQVLVLSCQVLVVSCVDGSGVGPDAWTVELVGVARRNGIRVLLLLSGAPARPDFAPELACDGFLRLDDASVDGLRRALHGVLAGEPASGLPATVRSPGLSAPIGPVGHRPGGAAVAVGPPAVEPGVPAVRLSGRERRVLELLAEGRSNRQIGAELALSEHGAKRLVAIVLSKLNTPNRTQAVAVALRHGLLEHTD